jgi:hypothetical protein
MDQAAVNSFLLAMVRNLAAISPAVIAVDGSHRSSNSMRSNWE